MPHYPNAGGGAVLNVLTLGLVAWNRASSDIFQIVGSRGVKAARDVDGSVLPKNDTARVDQVEVGPFDRGLDRAVYR